MRSLEPLGAEHIRATYERVLGDFRLGRPGPSGDDDRAHLAGTLRGQLQTLLEELDGRADEFHGEVRATADHVTVRAREALAVGVAAARDPEHLHDMAVLARSLLELCRLPLLPPPPGSTQTPLPHCVP